MRVVVTGATGVIGRAALPHLVTAGHDVVAVHRHPEAAEGLRHAGARPTVTDLFDPDAVRRLVAGADAVVHLATAMPPLARMARPSAWRENDRLRDEATRLLVDASLAAAVEVFVQESITFNYVDAGDRWIDEADPVAPLFAATASALTAEQQTARVGRAGRRGVVLRLAQLYGPGRASAELVEAITARRVPVVGTGRNHVASLHVADAGTAVAAALGAPSGTYNVCDDEPVPSGERLDHLAAALGASRPRRVPRAAARLLAGRSSRLLTVSQRTSNRRFRQTVGWAPAHASVREGWATVVDTTSAIGSSRAERSR